MKMKKLFWQIVMVFSLVVYTHTAGEFAWSGAFAGLVAVSAGQMSER